MPGPRPDSAAGAQGPAIILVEPQMGENIGAAARGMWNFGLDRMRVVAPRDGWPNPRAAAMASGAGRVLDAARIFGSTGEAVADLNFVYATTARPRGVTTTVLTPEAAARDARARIARGEKVGVLFGRERTGLETDDVVRANAIVSVPVNPGFASLNLAQCVLLMSYEWRKAGAPTADAGVAGGADLAESGAVEMMTDHLIGELDDAHFFHPETKRASMLTNLRSLFRRAPLTDQDVRMLRGVIRALSEKRRR